MSEVTGGLISEGRYNLLLPPPLLPRTSYLEL